MLMTVQVSRLLMENARPRRIESEENSPFIVHRDESMFALSARMLYIYRGGNDRGAQQAVRGNPDKALEWIDLFGESCKAGRWLWRTLLNGKSRIWQNAKVMASLRNRAKAKPLAMIPLLRQLQSRSKAGQWLRNILGQH